MSRTEKQLAEMQKQLNELITWKQKRVQETVILKKRIALIDQWIKRISNPAPSAMKALVNFIIATIPPDELEKVLHPKEKSD